MVFWWANLWESGWMRICWTKSADFGYMFLVVSRYQKSAPKSMIMICEVVMARLFGVFVSNWTTWSFDLPYHLSTSSNLRSVFRTKNCSSRDWTATDCEMRWAIQRWWLLLKFCGIFRGWRASWWVFVLVLRNKKSSVATGTGHLTFHANLYLYVWIWHEFCP